jgi:hypothetical protein
MAGDSLILGDQVEMLQGGVVSAIPACAGAVFLLVPGYDLGAPQPDTDQVTSLVLDGERPVTARRASNRTIGLPVKITVPGQSGTAARATLAAAREVLARIADQETFHLTWTRDGGLALLLDCFRATAVPEYELTMDQQAVSVVTFSCTALPFGRSDVPTVADFPVPVAGGTAPPSPVTIDDYTVVTGNPAWVQSALGPGPNSAYFTAGGGLLRGTATYQRSGLGAKNLAGLAGLTVWAGFGAPAGLFPYFGLRRGGPVRFTFTVSDGTHSASRHITRNITISNSSFGPVWQKIRLPVPFSAAVNYAAVTGYTISVSNEVPGSLAYTDVYLDSLLAVPVASAGTPAPPSGTVWDLAGIDGSARSAMSLQVQQPQGALQQVTKLFTTVGPVSWLVPAECTNVQALGSLGAGGKGSRSTSSGPYAGAPAGEGAWEFGIPVTPGDVWTGSIPHGGQSNSGQAGNTTFTIGALTVTGHGASNRADGVTGVLAGTATATYAPVQKMSGDTSTFDTSIANWTGAGNCTVARTTVNPRSGAGALQLTSTAGGDMTAASCTAASIASQGIGTWGLSTVPLQGFARAVSTGRSFQVGAEFYDVNNASLGQLFSGSVSDVTTGYASAGSPSLTAPAGARRLRYLVKVLATGGAGEVHKFDDLTIQTGQSWAGGSGAAISGTTSGGGGGVGGNTAAGGNGAAPAGGAAGSGSPASGKGGTGRTNATFGQGAKGGTPGGGGAGAQAGLLPQILDGGLGGDGGISLAFQQRPAFKTLVLHRPGFDAPDTFTPFVSIPPTDTPDGTTEYPVPSLVPGSNARFGSASADFTVTVYAVSAGWHNPSASRAVTVTVNQYEQNGGTVYASPITRTVTPSALASPLLRLGELTLPDHAMPDDNVNAYFTATITSDDTADSFQEFLFLHTSGSTVIVESPVAYSTYWVDEPVAGQETGNVMASQFDRNDAVSVLAYAIVSGPPLHMDPLGNQSLLAYTADAGMLPPAVQATYWPRWLIDRMS